MKTKLSLTALLSFIFCLLSSQVPQGFNYQAIARLTTGDPIINTTLPVRITIQADSLGTSIIWQELHSSVTTNGFGLMTLILGKGARQAASTVATFNAIDWSVTPKFIKTEIDYSGWKTMGVTRLWSVPYALRAKDSDQWTTSGSNIYRATGNVGIGTTTPTRKLDVIGVIKGVTLTGAGATAGQFQSWTEGGAAGQRAVYSFYPTFEATPGGYFPRRAADIVGGFNGGNWGTEFLSFNVGSNGAANDVENLTNEKMRITSSGNIGIGTTNPTKKVEIGGTGTSIYFNSSTSNLLEYNMQGVAPPSFTTRSNGTKIALYPGVSATTAEYALGIDASTFWMSVPNNTGTFKFYAGTSEIMRIMGTGNVGIGTTSPASKLDVSGDIRSTNKIWANVSGATASYFRGGNDAELWDVDVANTLAIRGVENSAVATLRLGSSSADISGSNGNIGIGTTNPTSKFVVQPDGSWDDNTPLFEVRNKTGVPIFAVYNNGVRILVDHTLAKAVKGGFAVGGYDMTKAGKTVDLMMVSPDSIRFNINNDNVGKGLKGGFAVGGYDVTTKGPINQDFMYLTPQSSTGNGYNTFLGYKAGISSTTGIENVMIGYEAGYFNNTGSQNVFIGKYAGQYNRSGEKNVILGWADYLAYGSDPGDLGSKNTLIGYSTGLKATGDENTAMGYLAGRSLVDGTQNTLIGSTAGYAITNGNANVFVGAEAGNSTTTGVENVFVGGAAGWSNTTGSNNIALGCDAQVPTVAGSNQIRLGDTRITYAGIQVAWTVTSDVKWKESIEDLSLGLNLVKGLKPVSYIRKNNVSRTTEAGFIAQDVQELFNEKGIKNSGLLSVGNDGSLELRYNDFIPILTKAMKEQQEEIESAKQENLQLKSELQSLKEKMDKIEAMLVKGGME